jgi:hypothetical protein
MSPSDLLRFLGRVAVHPVTQCWIWTGHTDDKGYGQFSWHGKPQWAHRLAYATFVAPVPAGVEIDHKKPCHNPSCVNPDHLRLLTHSENSSDANRRRHSRESSGVKRARDCDVPF